jgi:hypothetical protein
MPAHHLANAFVCRRFVLVHDDAGAGHQRVAPSTLSGLLVRVHSALEPILCDAVSKPDSGSLSARAAASSSAFSAGDMRQL